MMIKFPLVRSVICCKYQTEGWRTNYALIGKSELRVIRGKEDNVEYGDECKICDSHQLFSPLNVSSCRAPGVHSRNARKMGEKEGGGPSSPMSGVRRAKSIGHQFYR